MVFSFCVRLVNAWFGLVCDLWSVYRITGKGGGGII